MSKTREVVETIEFGQRLVYEVEEFISYYNEGNGAWSVLRNTVDKPTQYESFAAAKEVAQERSKLYHRDTRVVKVTP